MLSKTEMHFLTKGTRTDGLPPTQMHVYALRASIRAKFDKLTLELQELKRLGVMKNEIYALERALRDGSSTVYSVAPATDEPMFEVIPPIPPTPTRISAPCLCPEGRHAAGCPNHAIEARF